MIGIKRYLTVLMVLGIAIAVSGQSVFDMPKLFPQHRRFLAEFVTALQEKNWLTAEVVARSAVKIFPNDANWHYNVACVCARQSRVAEGLEWLEKAIRLGFKDLKQLQEDADLMALRQSARFPELLSLARQQVAKGTRNETLNAALAQPLFFGNEAVVTAENTQWEWHPVNGGYMTSLFAFTGARKVKPEAYAGPFANLIRPWLREGSAAGNAGDLYVNRDEDRTQVAFDDFPLLTPVVYSEDAQQSVAHVGMANGVFSSGITPYATIGTSAVALGSTAFWRSIPRLITTEAEADACAFRLAQQNQLYIYDASVDCSEQQDAELLVGHSAQFFATAGGRAPAEAQKEVEALAELLLAGLAAMSPETKQEMLRRGALVPTFQMLVRQHLKGVNDYCSAKAHPLFFDADQIDGAAFVTAAHRMRVEDLPVMFQVAARYETMPRQYVDYFDAPNSERISDTPWSIKRVIRGKEKTRKMTVSAVSAEPNVTYKWFVVNGMADKIRIRPLVKNGALATIEVDYHGVYEQAGVKRRHVDIACVALRKGQPASQPCFISFRYLANEQRVYDANGRIESIDYRMPETGAIYEDPALSAFKNWRDDYRYDAAGKLKGWERTRADGTQQSFDAHGRRILETSSTGEAKKVVEVKYFPRMHAVDTDRATLVIELLQADTERVSTL